MRPTVITVGNLTTADPAAVSASQKPNAGNLLINGNLSSGGVATLDTYRHVAVASDANDSNRTFAITGLTFSGVQTETVTGPSSGNVSTVLDFKTVTQVAISGNATGNITVGTNGVAGSPWFRFDDYAPSNTSVQCTVSGTVNYTVQSTLDDTNLTVSPVLPVNVAWVASSDTNVVGATATRQSNFLFSPTFARVLLNSGTGNVTTTFIQSSNGPI